MKSGAADTELIKFVKTCTPYRFASQGTDIIKQSIIPSGKSLIGVFPRHFWNSTQCFYERGFGQYDNPRNGLTFGAIGFFISKKLMIKTGLKEAILSILDSLPKRKGFTYFKHCEKAADHHIFYGRVYYKKEFGGRFPRREMTDDLAWLIQQTLPAFTTL